MKKSFTYLLLVILLILGCKPKATKGDSILKQTTVRDNFTIKKIDVHAHYEHQRDYLPELFKKWNMQGVLVDVSIADSTGVNRSWDSYLAHSKSEPELFYLCSSFIGLGIDNPDFIENIIEKLDTEIASGAKMVKVWKNFGMVTKDNSGNYIQIDDSRLQPIWDYLQGRNIPVMAHIGEPIQAWRPLDDPNNPHFGYYTEHPEYHAYTLPEIPSYESIISARDRWVERNPNLKILCAHLGSMSHDVNMVAERLDKFPNIYVECGARFGDLARQDTRKVQAFFDKYQDRILFGSDYGNSSLEKAHDSAELQQERENLDNQYTNLWRYLSSADSVTIRGHDAIGINLPIQILEKVYYQNAVKLLQIETK